MTTRLNEAVPADLHVGSWLQGPRLIPALPGTEVDLCVVRRQGLAPPVWEADVTVRGVKVGEILLYVGKDGVVKWA